MGDIEYGDVTNAPVITASAGASTPRPRRPRACLGAGRRRRRPPDAPRCDGPTVAGGPGVGRASMPPSTRRTCWGFDVTAGARNLIGTRDLMPAPVTTTARLPDTRVVPRVPGEAESFMSRSAIRISALFAVALAIAPAHAQRPGQGEDDSAALVDEGRAALKRGDLEGASKALDQAIALNPRRVEAYVLRSAVYAARKEYGKGIELMLKAREPRAERRGSADGARQPARAVGRCDARRTAARAGRREERAALRRAAVARPPLPHHGQVARRDHRVRGVLHVPAETTREGRRAAPPSTWPMLPALPPAREGARRVPARAAERKTDLPRAHRSRAATRRSDCRKAAPAAQELEPIAETIPTCGWSTGSAPSRSGISRSGFALGRRYLERSPPKSVAAGHARKSVCARPRRAGTRRAPSRAGGSAGRHRPCRCGARVFLRELFRPVREVRLERGDRVRATCPWVWKWCRANSCAS